jgi:hypothetical protein
VSIIAAKEVMTPLGLENAGWKPKTNMSKMKADDLSFLSPFSEQNLL